MYKECTKNLILKVVTKPFHKEVLDFSDRETNRKPIRERQITNGRKENMI
jgi:hypothetical protein